MNKVRRADLSDLDDLVRMAKNFYDAYAGLRTGVGFDPVYVRTLLTGLVRDPNIGLVLITDVDGAPVGMFVAMAHPGVTSHALQATEMAWWVEPEHRGPRLSLHMVRQFEAWASERGCALATLSCIQPFKGNQVRKLYQRMGFRGLEESFAKRLA